MPLELCVSCPNEDCDLSHEPIRLVLANRERMVADPVGWPEDETKLYIACPACRRVSVHSKADLCPECDQSVVRLRIRRLLRPTGGRVFKVLLPPVGCRVEEAVGVRERFGAARIYRVRMENVLIEPEKDA
jgi:hypothetical protein